MHSNTRTHATVTFARAHTHAGKAYAPGDQLAVYKLDAAWLVAQGVARFSDPSAPIPEPTPSTGDTRRTATPGDHHGS